ncbi:hypothetical protein RRG08_019059 [Elysia crispata]|uniref:Uncharacterized protein n=1 Tax=Elysia crispata TaxID=231223 RepID=A0AAE1A519_9GAST|nr:hypothetical protein RRG08_019059 [Elysia crispata]
MVKRIKKHQKRTRQTTVNSYYNGEVTGRVGSSFGDLSEPQQCVVGVFYSCERDYQLCHYSTQRIKTFGQEIVNAKPSHHP